MHTLTFKSIEKILEKRERSRLLFFAWLRVGANSLDLAGIAGIALLATSFGSLVSGNSRSPITLPILGEVLLEEYQAVLIALGVAVTFLLKSVFSIWLNLLTSLTVARIEGRLSTKLAEDFFAPSSRTSAVIATESVSAFQNKVMSSTAAIGSFLNARLTFVAEASLSTAMVIVFFAINPVATASMFLFMGTVLFGLNKLIGFRISRNGRMGMLGSQTSLQTTRDLFGVKREALSSGVIPFWLRQFSGGRLREAESKALNYTLHSLPRYVVETSLVLGIFAFIAGVVVLSDLASQAVTIGVFMAGGLRLVASLLPLQSAFNSMQDSSAWGQLAFDGLMQIKASDQSRDEQGDLDFNGLPDLEFKNVYFSYEDAANPVLIDVSFSVQPFSKVAIVGPSGAGKSTLFDLATGFREPSSGSINLGGFTPRSVMLKAPGTFGIVPQRPHLVSGSLLKNVSLVDDASSNIEKVKQSLDRSGLEKFTRTEDWFELQISPDSGQFSGGEIQRLGLARALYQEPKILFLDEATSALDAETEAEITKVLHSLKSEMTIILIAHRLSTVQHADKLIYLERGRILAEGTFAELKTIVPNFSTAVQLMNLD